MRLTIVLLSFFLSFCTNNIDNQSYKITPNDFIGKWLVTSSYPTNGPICIFIEENDTVSITLNTMAANSFIFSYTSEGKSYQDQFEFQIQENKIFGTGFYHLTVINNKGNLIDTTYPQNILLELQENKIKCSIEHGIYDLIKNTLIFGEVSNFIAIKI